MVCGMGRTIYSIALNSIGYVKDFSIKGFIDDNLSALKDFKGYPPILNRIDSYMIQPNDAFV